MTNEQAKQEAIKKSVNDYYDNYPLVKPYVQGNGYFPITNGYISNLNDDVKAFYKSLDGVDYLQAEDHEKYNSHFRPKELSKIIANVETNNGWIRIEPDGSNLPKKDIDCHIIIKSSGNVRVTRFYLKNFKGWNNVFTSDHVIGVGWENVTHYKPIEKELLPIY